MKTIDWRIERDKYGLRIFAANTNGGRYRFGSVDSAIRYFAGLNQFIGGYDALLKTLRGMRH